MKLHLKDEYYKIYQGSMLDLLEIIEPNTIDSVVTDPPYELNFMNKGWDRSGIAFQKETWQKCYEVLKPGGYLLAFGGSRTFHRIAVAIEDAGFEIRDVIMWVYGSGFPKSHNIGLSVDKMLGEKNRGHRIATASRYHPDGTLEPNGDNLPPYEAKQEKAKQWQGWGTQLKPSYEPIIVARKPLIGTVAQNILEYGVGGLNIDGCRVETNEDDKYDIRHYTNEDCFVNDKPKKSQFQIKEKNILGRFPANFIHDGSDEVVSLFPDSDGAGGSIPNSKITGYGKNIGDGTYEYYGGDRKVFESGSGSASRFFYTSKASIKDKDEGLNAFEKKQVGSLQGGNSNKEVLDDVSSRFRTSKRNIHPTVKPCDLMQYLVRLVTPKNGIILDPFMGSGSTGKATMFENREREANYKFIGIDLDDTYCSIASARIDYALNKFEYEEKEIREKDKENGILSIFDFMD